ncbi:ribonuclease BN-like family protein [Streptococcus equi subsp. zooepidemicus Sz35]|uniref:Ribonuclease BN-like family protein n=1 Tax=Streptococcus equi subsp. zooepidemicus (strain H70) TaxID=553483 RepID=C0MCK5_STRS7|nr:YihY/virulence factor BrkB family protein [Streptococcus equi]KIS12784.1 ribonuclease BN-like family protein [Streptococcus equi subsp. zooepidemicus SzAM60]KIS20833.1 ribonuclease BN-like family protein [Streptococcus equi subsp. zooepidemicus Sz35]MCD3373550.1 YihY/virulence factor BrkB family protein [Streptococcus equi subsp. zooepidemicus]MCD3389074.1 YihY/virulence factor BrkB family protein [Streptococcus equi subsp. zooepidemicus]MCD3402175.1 YihY/virulence factor BrkB family protei
MSIKKFLDKVISKWQYEPIQAFMRHFQSAEMDLSAIAVAYYLILTAFPLIVIAANIFPYLNIDISDLLRLMKEQLPKDIYRSASSIVVNIFSKPSGGVLGIATLTGLWTMSRSLASLQKAFNKAYDASEHRDFLLGHLVGLLTSLLILFLLTFALIFSTFSKAAIQVLDRHYHLNDNITTLFLFLIQPITILIIFVGLMLLYFLLPNIKIKKIRYILPGTFFTTFVMIFLSNMVGNYVVHNVERMVDIKTFGSVMVFIIMLWFIFLARILIMGAVFNATYQELSIGKLEGRSGNVVSLIKKTLGNDGAPPKK